MKIDVGIHFNFEVSQGEFRLMIQALKKYGGKGEMLAADLEAARSKHFTEIARRFSTFSSSNNNEDGE